MRKNWISLAILSLIKAFKFKKSKLRPYMIDLSLSHYMIYRSFEDLPISINDLSRKLVGLPLYSLLYWIQPQ